MLDLSRHARVRQQERVVPRLVIDLLLEFGKVERSHSADRYFLDRKSRKELVKKLGGRAYEALRPLLNTYVVVSDGGEIVTVARRLKRFRR
jgi:hypothetical protein